MIYTTLRFLNVGNATIVCATRILTIISPNSAPGQRILRKAKKDMRYIDGCLGRACKSVIVTDMDTVIGSILKPATLLRRLNAELVDPQADEKEEDIFSIMEDEINEFERNELQPQEEEEDEG